MFSKKTTIPSATEALPGRSEVMPVNNLHFVNGHPIQPPFADHLELAMFGFGCFWGAERKFWQHEGVFSTAVGYAAGHTPNPDYAEVCSGMTGHNEVVLVVFDPNEVDYDLLLKLFWESTIRLKACARVTMRERNIAQASTPTTKIKEIKLKSLADFISRH